LIFFFANRFRYSSLILQRYNPFTIFIHTINDPFPFNSDSSIHCQFRLFFDYLLSTIPSRLAVSSIQFRPFTINDSLSSTLLPFKSFGSGILLCFSPDMFQECFFKLLFPFINFISYSSAFLFATFGATSLWVPRHWRIAADIDTIRYQLVSIEYKIY
jgi:hypothetical protein